VLHRRWRPAGILPALALFALAGVLFARLVVDPTSLIVDDRRPSLDYANLGDPRPVGNDLTFLFLPHHLSIIKVISQYGHLPLWDSRGFGGRPLVGNPQGGLFYPPVWVVWWSGVPAALGWLTIGHLIGGGFGVYVLLRSADQGRWPATIAAGVYLASPFLLAHTFEGHYPHVWSACWYPWAFWAFMEQRAGRVRGLLILPLVLALTYLTGHPQEWYLLVLALSIWTLADAINSLWSGAWRPGVSKLLNWSGVMALSLGLAAVDVAPQWAVRPWLLRSHESGRGVELPGRYHLQAVNALQLLSPTALGGPSDYFGSDNYWETVFSIGLVPLVLAGIAVFRHPDRKAVHGWLVLVGLAVWFACGRQLGLFALLYSLAPGMSGFRVPARALFLANLGGAVLAGLGVETIRSAMTEPKDWRRLGVRFIGITMILLVGWASTDRGTEPVELSRTQRAITRVLHDGCFRFALSGMASLVLLGCLPPRRRNQRLAGSLLGLLALFELGWTGSSLLRVAPAEPFLDTGSMGAALAGGNPRGSVGASPSLEPPLRIKARDTFLGDLRAICLGIEKTNINDVFQLDHTAVLYESLYPVASRPRPYRLLMPANEPFEEFQRGVRQAVCDRMSVQFLVSDRVETDPPWPVFAEGQLHGSHFVIQRNPSALPRAYIVPRGTVIPEGASLALSYFREIDPRDSVLMNDDPLGRIAPGAHQSFQAAGWTSIDPDHPALVVTTEGPGLLVVADSWMPGWTARVDGRPVPILRGNHAQRVVPILQPGRHTIAMDYWPPGFTLGCAITGVSVLTWLLLVRGFVTYSSLEKAPRNAMMRTYIR
jgi:Bacterial membrane protein YfhO